MELREYYKIFKKNISVVASAVIILIAVAYAWSVRISETYNASLLLNISRAETQSTPDYRFDQFYRMQADDKFAETVVSWLKSPGVARDIFAKANVSTDQKTMRQLATSFRSEKLSSNLVGVSFGTLNEDEAKKIGSALSDVVTSKTSSLDDSHDPNWFRVDASNLVILKNTQNMPINIAIAAIAGLFIGTLLAFGKHYISD